MQLSANTGWIVILKHLGPHCECCNHLRSSKHSDASQLLCGLHSMWLANRVETASWRQFHSKDGKSASRDFVGLGRIVMGQKPRKLENSSGDYCSWFFSSKISGPFPCSFPPPPPHCPLSPVPPEYPNSKNATCRQLGTKRWTSSHLSVY